MADQLDVAARLAEGRPAVDDFEEYVVACRRLGFQHHDLTARPSQVRDWYDGEEGMDLRALDADHGALSAAASVAEDALRLHAELAAQISGAWSGRGAAAASEFVWRSWQSAHMVSVAMRSAADAVAMLRDAAWRAVDAKVAATEAVDARQQPHRAEWLAAVRTVTSGTGDLAAASELIDQQVKPFVNVDIGSDWLAAMRAAVASINAAYDVAIARTTTPRSAVFGVPGVLGPDSMTVVSESAAAPTVPAAAVAQPVAAPWPGPAFAGAAPSAGPPPAWAGPPTLPVSPSPALPAALPGPPADVAPIAPALPPSPSSTLGGGTESSLSNFGSQLADLIGGLVGSARDGSPTGIDDVEPIDTGDPLGEAGEGPDDEEADDDKEDSDEEEGEVDEEDPDEEEGEAEEEEAEEPPVEEPGEPAAQPPSAASAPEPTPPPPAPAPVEAPPEREKTPCEIAADELPQVGE